MDTKCHSHSPTWDQGGPSISVEGSALCFWDILNPQVPVTPWRASGGVSCGGYQTGDGNLTRAKPLPLAPSLQVLLVEGSDLGALCPC